MKKLYLIILLILIVNHINSQIVNIPDVNFKAALVADTLINTNQDAEIQVSEANSYSGLLSVGGFSIYDLTGIEEFTSITELWCWNNQLTSLDLSSNTALTYLNCYNNQLISLNVSNNTALTDLRCFSNQLSTLDISNNTALTQLWCNDNLLSMLDVSNNIVLTNLNCSWNSISSLDVSNNTALSDFRFVDNQFSSLDVSNNTALTILDCSSNLLSSLDLDNNIALSVLNCYNNQLTSLNVYNNNVLTTLACHFNQLTSLYVKNGNNVGITLFSAINNPNLYCIEVDDSTWSATNWFNIDPQSYFSEDCIVSVPDQLQKTELTIYPNPTTGLISITDKGLQITDLKVYDIYGKTLTGFQTLSGLKEIDLSQNPKGIYIIKVTTSKGVAVEKVVKK